MASHKPSRTPRGLAQRARNLVRKQGYFLLLYDVIRSREYPARALHVQLREFIAAVRQNFGSYLTVRTVGTRTIDFDELIGDGGGGFFTSAEVMPGILRLAETMLPFAMRWNVAEDEWDRENVATIK